MNEGILPAFAENHDFKAWMKTKRVILRSFSEGGCFGGVSPKNF